MSVKCVSARRYRDLNRGFTLVELLVVIAIIALLMSIMMPALSKVRDQAKAVICQSNVRGWGQIALMFTGDNDGKFWDGWRSRDNPEGLWPRALEPYYGEDKDFRLCPSAKKLSTSGIGRGSTNMAWDARKADWIGLDGEDDYGSYGLNGWLPCESAFTTPDGIGVTGEEFWRTMNVRRANQIPMFMDAKWWKVYARNIDLPPRFENAESSSYMPFFCIPRHNKEEINGVFMDLSVRKVGLKELWTLRWNRTQGEPRELFWEKAAPWMAKFKDY